MTVIRKEYIYQVFDYTDPDPGPAPMNTTPPFWTEPTPLPQWFIDAPTKYKKIIRISGATAGISNPADGTQSDISKGVRLFGPLAKYFATNGFIMMLNNYNNVKEYEITYTNIRDLSWSVVDFLNHAFPPIGEHLDLVIEMEILLTQDD
jgi:hypothetical protein